MELNKEKMKMIRKGIGLALGLLMASAVTAMAAIPAPPVDQKLGIPDTVFNNMNESVCRSCHNQAPPITAVDKTYLPDRHHALVGTVMPAGTVVPFPGGTTYNCVNCHSETFNGTFFEFTTFRDCMFCHQQAGGFTVHHATTQAQAGDCVACHGAFVENGIPVRVAKSMDLGIDPTTGAMREQTLNVATWVPTYQPSLVTPWTSNKPTGGTVNPKNLQKQGSCKYCHDTPSGNVTPAGQEVAPAFANQTFNIYRNVETHHGTGFGQISAAKCDWCHIMANGAPQASGLAVRVCENCHGIKSLHNIQAKGQSVGTPIVGTVVVGGEGPGKGHIGDNFDCNGCHGFTAAAAPMSGATVPALYNLTASSVTAGTAVTAQGVGFVNTITSTTGTTYTVSSQVALTNANGVETILVPSNLTGDSFTVTLPATLPTGNYTIAAKKGTQYSNPLNITITPQVAITGKSVSRNVATITGTGFGTASLQTVNAVGSGMSVTGVDKRGKLLKGTVTSWSNTKVMAKFSTTPVTVTVNTIYGSATK